MIPLPKVSLQTYLQTYLQTRGDKTKFWADQINSSYEFRLEHCTHGKTRAYFGGDMATAISSGRLGKHLLGHEGSRLTPFQHAATVGSEPHRYNAFETSRRSLSTKKNAYNRSVFFLVQGWRLCQHMLTRAWCRALSQKRVLKTFKPTHQRKPNTKPEVLPRPSQTPAGAGEHPLPLRCCYIDVADRDAPSPWSSPTGSVDVGFVFRGRRFFFQGGEGWRYTGVCRHAEDIQSSTGEMGVGQRKTKHAFEAFHASMRDLWHCSLGSQAQAHGNLDGRIAKILLRYTVWRAVTKHNIRPATRLVFH